MNQFLFKIISVTGLVFALCNSQAVASSLCTRLSQFGPGFTAHHEYLVTALEKASPELARLLRRVNPKTAETREAQILRELALNIDMHWMPIFVREQKKGNPDIVPLSIEIWRVERSKSAGGPLLRVAIEDVNTEASAKHELSDRALTLEYMKRIYSAFDATSILLARNSNLKNVDLLFPNVVHEPLISLLETAGLRAYSTRMIDGREARSYSLQLRVP
jgi:hypothetical protein